MKRPSDPFIIGKYNLVKKEYRKLLKNTKSIFEINSVSRLRELTSHPKHFWKHLKKITSSNKSSPNGNLVPPDLWIEHFSSLNRNNPNDLREQDPHVRNVMDEVSATLSNATQPLACPTLDSSFTSSEIENGIRRLKSGKASGCDAINNDMIKAATELLAPILCNVFNRLLELEHYPIQWATGLIMPLHKSGELIDPNNYRGITINSCVSKLFTLLLNDRITSFCESNQKIAYNQVVFRK